jgi:ABC-type sugar transport system substrate-binding protein
MNDGANDYRQMQRVECQEAARRRGFALDVYAAGNNAETQLAQVRSALTESRHITRRRCS